MAGDDTPSPVRLLLPGRAALPTGDGFHFLNPHFHAAGSLLSRRSEASGSNSAGCGANAEIVDAGQDRIAEEIHRCDLFCGHAKVPVDWDRVVAGGRLVWTQSSAAGLDWLFVPSVIESPMIVTSASGVLADQVAEHTVALITAITRSLPAFFRAQAKKEYVRLPTARSNARHGGDRGIWRCGPARVGSACAI